MDLKNECKLNNSNRRRFVKQWVKQQNKVVLFLLYDTEINSQKVPAKDFYSRVKKYRKANEYVF